MVYVKYFNIVIALIYFGLPERNSNKTTIYIMYLTIIRLKPHNGRYLCNNASDIECAFSLQSIQPCIFQELMSNKCSQQLINNHSLIMEILTWKLNECLWILWNVFIENENWRSVNRVRLKRKNTINLGHNICRLPK